MKNRWRIKFSVFSHKPDGPLWIENPTPNQGGNANWGIDGNLWMTTPTSTPMGTVEKMASTILSARFGSDARIWSIAREEAVDYFRQFTKEFE